MIRAISILFLLAASVAAAAEIAGVIEQPSQLDQFEIGEIKLQVSGEFSNPFDPREVEVWAEVSGPDEREYVIPGFYTRDFEITLDEEHEVFTPTSDPYFCVRLTCEDIGTHTAKVCAKDSQGRSCADEFEFECKGSDNTGFINIHHENERYLADSRGNTFVPIGINQCWDGELGSFAYDEWLSRLAQSGGNFTRLWQTHYGAGYTVEWGDYHHSGLYCGLGCYSLEAAARLDRIFKTARGLGVHIQWVINHHSAFEVDMWSSWEANPFNADNGGPCETSLDFFTSEEANRLYDARIRYLVARYSAFTSLFAWELFNEIDLIQGVDVRTFKPWQREKAELIHGLDPYGHLVTTSYSNPIYLPPSHDWTYVGYDLVQKHQYIPAPLLLIGPESNKLWPLGKPFLMSEFGIDFLGKLDEHDPLGIAYHNAIWCALATGYAGTPAVWWWDGWVDQYDWYRHLAPVAELVKSVDLARLERKTENFHISSASTDFKAFGMRGDGLTLVWILDERSRWWGSQDSNFPDVTDATITMYDLCGKYRATVWNTFDGGAEQVEVDGCPPALQIPTFKRDVALTFEWIDDFEPAYQDSPEVGEGESDGGCGCELL